MASQIPDGRLRESTRRVRQEYTDTGQRHFPCAFAHWFKLGMLYWPLGKLVQIVGDAFVGKTTYALRCAAAAQAQGLSVGYLDADGTLDPKWTRTCGVDSSKLLYTVPASLEKATELATAFVSACDVVIWDTFSALPTERDITELEHGIFCSASEAHLRRVGTNCVYRLHRLAVASNTLFVIICQERSVNTTDLFAPVHARPAAPRALASLSVLRLRMSSPESEGGRKTQIDITGSKLFANPSGSSCTVDLTDSLAEFAPCGSVGQLQTRDAVFEHWSHNSAGKPSGPHTIQKQFRPQVLKAIGVSA